MSNFVHLHVHSHYSLLDGLGQIPHLINRAKELEMPALALTDHGNMYGAVEFFQEAQKKELQPIIGVEAYISPRAHTSKSAGIDTKPYHLVLLSYNEIGYKNLIQITSEAHLVGYYYKPRIDKEYLRKHSKGLIALSACLVGEIPRKIQEGDLELAKKTILEYQAIFGKDNYFLELQDHPLIPEQEKVNKQVIKFARDLSIPLVATNDVHYVNIEDKEAHQLLLCVQTGKTIYDSDKMEYTGDFSLRTTEDMNQTFKEVPDAIENSLLIADRCKNMEIKFYKDLLPHFPIPTGEDENVYLKNKCQEGLKKRYGEITDELQDRLDYELDTIAKMGFSSYFLIVADFVNYAKSNRILVGPGRGSAAGSIVAYTLEITDIDPMRYHLLFERFLNPDRISMPDIDMDFADDRRGEVIKYVMNKYGTDHVAGIITFGTMAARMAVRDVGRALGMSYGEVDRIAKLVPPPLQGRHTPLASSVKESDELKQVYTSEEQTKKLLDFSIKLEGVVRHASQHACAIVISREPLTEYTPVQMAQKGDVGQITQYSAKPIEQIGLLKMDFLGLSNLTIIQNALRIIKKLYGKVVDIHNLPLDDKKTFNLLGRGDTTGVFQLESSGMKRYIRDLKPTQLEDIIAMVSLYRPGPMQWIDSFINRKHGREKVTYEHSLMESALQETYGIPVYQEQVMQVAKDMAGFTGGQADTLRKAMGKKIAKLMKEMKEKFIEGSVANGVAKEKAEKIFIQFEEFAAYGFNKSHAACYAMIAYQTAYLKAHYPAAFMAALLTSDFQNLDRITIELNECEKMGIHVLQPDVNESFVEFGVVKDSGNIRFGLSAIKNVGFGVAESIVNERNEHGPYLSITDFADRLPSTVINKKSIEALAKSGALDCLGERNAILTALEQILKIAQDKNKRLSRKQDSLFAGNEEIENAFIKLKLPETEPASNKEKLAWEKELLGIYLSDHPLKIYENKLKSFTTPIASLNDTFTKPIAVSGIITNGKKIITKSGKPMLFVGLEDTTASTEVLVFPKVLEKTASVWGTEKIVTVVGRVSNKDNEIKILAENGFEITDEMDFSLFKDSVLNALRVMPERDYRNNYINNNKETDKGNQNNNENVKKASKKENPKFYIIDLPRGINKNILIEIKAILNAFPGETPVLLRLPFNGGYKEISTRAKVKTDERLDRAIKKIIHS